MKHALTQNDHDYIIIGAGPAGLQLAYYLEKACQSYLVIDGAAQPASFFEQFPRRRKLISFNKIHSLYNDSEIRLRWDWNSLLTDDYDHLMEDYSQKLYPTADELVTYLRDFASKYALKLQMNTRIARVHRLENGLFRLTSQEGVTYTCRALIVATGFAKPYLPPIKGIEQVTESYENVSLEPNDFLGQRVLIIGKGNSAFEIADNLLETTAIVHLASPESIQFAWNTRFAGHLRADYSKILDTYQLKLLNGGLDCTVDEIRREGEVYVVTVTYTHAEGEVEELVYDRVIRAAGFQFDDSIFDESCKPALCDQDKLPESTSAFESTNIPNLFFGGTLMQYRDFQTTASAFIDGFRYNMRTLWHIMQARFQGGGLQHDCTPLEQDALYEMMITRICRTSALWAQFGFLCDVIVLDEAAGIARHYQELPTDHVAESELGGAAHYLVITFEWGPWEGDVFKIERQPAADTAFTNAFLHPIIRRYVRGECVEVHHILEDLFGMYRAEWESGIIRRRSNRDITQYHQEEHEAPLRRFIAGALSQHGVMAAQEAELV